MTLRTQITFLSLLYEGFMISEHSFFHFYFLMILEREKHQFVVPLIYVSIGSHDTLTKLATWPGP